MKKSFFAFAALAAILAGCAKEITRLEDTTDPVSDVKVTLRASVPENETKVSTDAVGTFKWQASDKVTVLNTAGSPFEFSTTEGGTAVDFSSNTFTGTLSTEAMYPASLHHASGKFYLEPSINWASEASMMPMVGVVDVENLTASFTSVGAVLKLVVYSVPEAARKLVVTSNSKQIVGEFTPSGTPKVIAAADSDSNKELTINFTAGHPSQMVFYIPLPTDNVGKLTFAFKDDSEPAATLFSKVTNAEVTLSRNQLINVPALNCDVLWSENFTGYVADDNWTDTNSASIITDADHGAFAYGGADITYTTFDGNSATKIYADYGAGGASPELLINKKKSDTVYGKFVVEGIPTNSATTMTLTFKSSNSIRLSATSGITIGSFGTGAGSKSVTLTNEGSLSSFDLTFYNDYSNNCRIDDIVLVKAPSAGSIPTLTSDNAYLTIPVGSTSASKDITYANKLDDLGIVAVVNDAAKSWLSAELTGTYPNYTLSATATGSYNGAEDRVGQVTIKGTGVSKVYTVTQKTCLVPNPTVSVVPGDNKFTATWTGNANATSYVAYLRESAGTPTEGTNITASITESAGTFSITDYAATNGTTYYLYVKVNEVAANYEAPEDYVMKSFKPVKTSTSSNPFSVAEALEIIGSYANGGQSENNEYVKGIVVSVGSLSSGKLTYNISDDGTETNQLKVYNGKGLDQANFSATTDLAAGDQVVICGKLYKYNSTTPEINANNYLISHNSIVVTPSTDILMEGTSNSVYSLTVKANHDWTATLDSDATTARGTGFAVLNSSDVVINGSISGSSGETVTLKFKALGDGNDDGSTVTTFGKILFTDGEFSTKQFNIKQSPKPGGPITPAADGTCFNLTSYSSLPDDWTCTSVETNASYFIVNTGGSMISPTYDLSSYDTAEVTVSIRNYGSGSGNAKATLYVSYDGGSSWNETTGWDASSSNSAKSYTLASSLTGQVAIKIANTASSGAKALRVFSFKLQGAKK